MSYYQSPYDADYFFNNPDGKGGYTDYTHLLTSGIMSNVADDIESQTGLVSGKKVAVLGCAFGYLCNILTQRGAEVDGVDISSYAIGQAETLYPALNFIEADALTSGLKKNDYDLIVANHLVQCMPDGDTFDLLIEHIYELVKPTGNFYGVDDLTPQYYFNITNSELVTKFDAWFGSGIAVITETGHLPICADRRMVVG